MTYTDIFGGNAVRPAEQSYQLLNVTSDTTLYWPSSGQFPATSAILDISTSYAGIDIRMPDARLASNGETVTIYNVGSYSFNILDSDGDAIVTIAAGLTYTIYLRSNSTSAGSWRAYQAGAGSSAVDAADLDGSGLQAYNGLLRVKMTVSSYSASQAFTDNDRGSLAVWTGGAGTFTMPLASSIGNGWCLFIKNSGSGTLTIASNSGETFDGAASVSLDPGESAIVASNGTNFSYINIDAIAASATFAFTSISVAGNGNYTLSASEYANTAIKFTGALTGNRTIIVPVAVKEYWIDNATTGAYTLTVKVSGQTGVVVTQGKRAVLYCDGTDVRAAETDDPAGVSTPVAIADGGTGATNAATALTNLGATATGSSVFTAANAAAARSAISAIGAGLITGSGLTMATARLLGRTTASTGAIEEITVGSGLSMSAGTLSATAAAAASDTVAGVVELATNAETLTGTDTARAITPANLTSKEATAAEYRNNTANKILTTDEVWSSAAPVALTPGANVALDLSTGINFTLAMSGNYTLTNPTNAKPGQSGWIEITQDGAGSKTLAYGTQYVSAGGSDPVLSTPANSIDVLYYTVLTSTRIQISLTKALA